MKKAVLCSTAVIAPMLAGIGLAGTAYAQGAASPAAISGGRLDEIVVMARRVSENLQTVPVAVTAYSAADFKKLGMQSLSDIQFTAPSVNIQNQNPIDAFGAQMSMRGVLNPVVQVSVALPIAVYVNGVYFQSGYGLNATGLYDVDRVEVLKGPQGTLFGQNTTAGAIAMYTRLPTNKFEAEVGLGAGSFGQITSKGMVNIPVVSDKFAVRVVGTYTKDDGYGRETGGNLPLADVEMWYLRGTLKFNPSEKLQIIAEGHGTDAKSGGVINKTVFVNPVGSTVRATALDLYGSATPADFTAALAAINNQIQTGGFYNRKMNTRSDHYPLFSNYDDAAASLTIDYDLPFAHLKSITAYDSWHDPHNNGFGELGRIVAVDQTTWAKQISQEVQLTGNALNDRLKYTFGAYYFHLKGYEYFLLEALPSFNTGSPTNQSSGTVGNNYAVYTQETFALTPKLNITAGVRWTKVDKVNTPTSTNPAGCQIPVAMRINGACLTSLSTSESKPSWTGGVDWSGIEDTLLYAKVSRGYTAGGPPQRVSAGASSYLPYEAETVLVYEIGSKSDFFDHRVRANLAAYINKYTNISRQVAVAIPNPTGGGTTFTAIFTNAAAATMKGAEAEIKVVPFDGADLGFNVAYIDAKYDTYLDRDLDVSFQKFQQVSKWQYSVTAGYEVPTPVGGLRGQLTWAWRSSFDIDPRDTAGAISGTGRGPGAPDFAHIQPGYGILNATIRWALDEYDAEVGAFVTNIAGKEYMTGGVSLINQGLGLSAVVPGQPRRWGVEVLKRF